MSKKRTLPESEKSSDRAAFMEVCNEIWQRKIDMLKERYLGFHSFGGAEPAADPDSVLKEVVAPARRGARKRARTSGRPGTTKPKRRGSCSHGKVWVRRKIQHQ